MKFAGETLFGAKQGVASALSKSADYGNVWNDFTLIDSGLIQSFTCLGDPSCLQAFIPAGYITDIYMRRPATRGISPPMTAPRLPYTACPCLPCQKVLCYSRRILTSYCAASASDAGVIYAADEGGTDLYYSADGGTTRWYKRVTPAAVADMAVESKTVVYVGDKQC